MQLQVLLQYYPTVREVSQSCLNNYRKHLSDLERFAGRELTTDEVTSHLVSSWLVAKLRLGRSAYYLASMRSSVMAVMKLAREINPDLQALQVPAIRRPDLLVRVWSPADVALLASRAERLPGKIGGLYPAGPYLSTLILAAWHTGLRRNDLHQIRREMVRDDGTFPFIQGKTGRRKPCWIPPDIIRRVTWVDSGPLWPRPGQSDEIVRRSFRQLVISLHLENPDFYFGCWRDIRRSAEHSAEQRHPGKGHQHAGHERRTYERYYQATQDKPEVTPAEIRIKKHH